MSPEARLAVDADLPDLLRRLLQQARARDDDGVQDSLRALGAQRCADRLTLVGALCLGGAAFAARIAAHANPDAAPLDHCACVLEAFCATVEPDADSPADHERRVAERLIAMFQLEASASSLLDSVRAEFLIEAGPIDDVPDAALAAMRHQQWELALQGFVRLQRTLKEHAPPSVYGTAALCLHKLGRYEEAERCIASGLGARRALIAIGDTATEEELLRAWGAHAAPVVSIVCTTYNHERYIESAIRGFLAQRCPFPFEILIHDDASTDRTQDIVRRWQARYPRLIRTVLQTENQYSRGGRPFELLLALARGRYVATCEGDDFWIAPDKLQRQVAFLEAHPDYACSAHNYYHFIEAGLSLKPWTNRGRDFELSPRQLMGLRRLLWLPTLVFRKTFSTLPPERALAPIGDQFLTSYLGTFGRCMYFENMLGAVRRENEFSSWSPLQAIEKERIRVKTWVALIRMHQRLGHAEAVTDLLAKVAASKLDASEQRSLLCDAPISQPDALAAA